MNPTRCTYALRQDMNADGVVTISDVWLVVKAIFLVPGNFIIDCLSRWNSAAIFLEIGPTSCGATLAIALSAVFWLALIGHISDRLFGY